MKKLLFLFIPLTLIGCGDSDGNGNTNVDPNETNNVLIVDGVEYPLESGTLLNYGGQQGLYNIDLDIYSPGVVVPDCTENSAIGQGHDIYFEIWTSQSDYLDSMTYNIVEDESESVGNITFSDYILDYNSDIDEQNWLEISLGTVDVLKSGDNYTISWNLTGELGEVITGNYSGTLMYCDISNNEPLDPIIGTWVLVNEEIVGGDWGDSCRGCFMENDAGSPDTFVFTSSDVTKSVWECFPSDGSLCSDLVMYGPVNWVNVGSNMYEIFGEPLQVTFIGNNQMQTPFEDGDIVQTWERQ